MKVVILCGGLGARLREETEFRPKPMVYIGHRPILWHIMKIYAHYGYNDFVLALGYKGEMIKEYFLNQKYFTHDFTIETKNGETVLYKNNEKDKDDFKITFVDTGQNSLTGERLRRVKEYLNGEPFMCTYGDGVSNINIKALVDFHKQKGKIGTITAVHPRSKWGLVQVDDNDMAVEFRQKPVLNEFVNGGFMVFENSFIDMIKEGEMIEEGLQRLLPQRELSVYNHKDFWFAMDTYQDLTDLNKLWLENPEWRIWN